MTGLPDCRTCGACCLGGYDDGMGFATVTEADHARMSARTRRRLVVIDHRFSDVPSRATPYVMTEDVGAVCAFLRGTPGRRVSCRIYETRPDVCRSWKPGSMGCREARRELGLE